MAGHDIRIAFNDDDLAAAGDVLLGKIEAVKYLALVVDRGLWCVQVLWPAVVIQQLAGPEPERLAGHVANRPDQPAAEAVVRTALTRAEKPGSHELLLCVAKRLEVLAQRVVRLRRKADAKALGCGLVETTVTQKPPPRLSFGRRELGDVELRRSLVGRQQTRPIAMVDRLAAILVVQFITEASSHPLYSLGEGDVIHLLQESEDITALTAAETVVKTDLRANMETWRPLLMEGAEALHRTNASALQRDKVADNVRNVGARPDLVNVTSSDQACHSMILRSTASGSSRSCGWLDQCGWARRLCQAMADWSVSDATWSTTARLRCASV